MSIYDQTAVLATYTNYRGETAERRLIPIRIRFATSEWHPEPQWLLDAFDLDRNAERSFALKDFRDWHPVSDPEPEAEGDTGIDG